MDRRKSRWEKTRQDQPQRREEGRAKTEEGEKKKEGRRESWQEARAGSVPQMCPHHPGGECAEWTGTPSSHTHTYMHKLHLATKWTGPHKQLWFIETVDVNHIVKCFSGFIWMVVGGICSL